MGYGIQHRYIMNQLILAFSTWIYVTSCIVSVTAQCGHCYHVRRRTHCEGETLKPLGYCSTVLLYCTVPYSAVLQYYRGSRQYVDELVLSLLCKQSFRLWAGEVSQVQTGVLLSCRDVSADINVQCYLVSDLWCLFDGGRVSTAVRSAPDHRVSHCLRLV